MATSLAICKIFEQVYKILLQDVSDFDASQPASFLQEPYVWDGSILLSDHLAMAINNGFFITSNEMNRITTLTLQMNATADKNGTEAYCTSLPSTRSDTAVLLIITGSYNDVLFFRSITD